MSADAEPQVANNIYVLNVVMSCGGCKGAIDRKLSKMEDVISFEVSLENQTATVETKGSVDTATLVSNVIRTGKTVLGGTVNGKDINMAEMLADKA